MLSIRLLGDFEVRRAGAPQSLPQSKKTRALLAYLAATARKHTREKLCELLWEIPDDPKGALRWSLSRLRQVVDEPSARRIEADRSTVSFDPTGCHIDLLQVRSILSKGVDAATTSELKAATALFQGDFCADLDMPAAPAFQLWLVGMRQEVGGLRRQILDTLCDRLAGQPEEAVAWQRERVAANPTDETCWEALIRCLLALGRRSEAEAQLEAARPLLQDVGGVSHRLEQVLRERPARDPPPAPVRAELRQEIRFCRATGGARIAYAVAGSGPPLVKTANWMNHLEYDWESPIWGHFLRGLASEHRLLRYDARGNGLSDWDVDQLSLDLWVDDLEAVVDAAGYTRFPLLGVSQGCAISIAYAARHPERVSHLILYAGFAAGAYVRPHTAEEREQREALTTLMRLGWGQADATFRQIFTSIFIPGATREQADAFNELQRRTASPECAVRYFQATARLDVRHLLSRVSVPTLVLHARGDVDTPVELGRQMAAGIPGARFVPLPGQNHLFLEGEPAATRFFEELRLFLDT